MTKNQLIGFTKNYLIDMILSLKKENKQLKQIIKSFKEEYKYTEKNGD